MKCPDCGAEEDIKWFLRHQDEGDDDDSTSANVITILCTTCGKNESHFLLDVLPDIFPSWEPREVQMNFEDQISMLGNLFGGMEMDPWDEEDEETEESEIIDEPTEE